MPIPRTLLAREEPRDLDLRVVAGAWPEGLSGELWVSAPHPTTLDGPHAFYGDGILHRLSLRPGTRGAPADRLAWRWGTVDSPSARLRGLRPDVFLPTMLGVTSPFGVSNANNTAPLPWGDRLFVTWDGGRPAEVDPHALRFLGEVGRRDDWRPTIDAPVLPFVQTTAHPVVDPERSCLWGANPVVGDLHVTRWSGEGSVQSWPVAGGRVPQSVHTVTQTRDWVVIADCAFKVELQVLDGGDRTEPNNPSEPLYLIRKDDLEATPGGEPVEPVVLEVAPETMHYYAVHDDSDGVRVVFEHTTDSDLAMSLRADDVDAEGRPVDPRLAGLYGMSMSPGSLTVLDVDPVTGKVEHRARLSDPDRFWSVQLSALDWSAEGMAAPRVRHQLFHGYRPEGVTRRHLALYADRVDPSRLPPAETPSVLATLSMPDLAVGSTWSWPVDDFPTSPAFVPRDPGRDPERTRYSGSRPGGEDGWVVVLVQSDDGFRVEVFDAAAVGRGPVAVAADPGRVLPFVIHAAWMPAPGPVADVERTRFGDELDRVDELPGDLADTARRVAADLDAQPSPR